MRRDPERPHYEPRGDAADELASHLEMEVERLSEQGMSREEAAREAAKRFGDRERALEECRRLDRRLARLEHRSDLVSDFSTDVRLASRGLRAAPGFTLAAVLSLGLAIGATTALFSVVRGVVLRPLGYHHPERLALLSSENQQRGWDGMPLPQGVHQELSSPGGPFELAVYREQEATLLGALEPKRLRTAAVSQELFSLLGAAPVLGRAFAEDDDPGAEGHPCLTSHRLWRSDLGAGEDALGRVLDLEGDVASCRVIGVLPSGFDFPEPETDLWTLFRVDPSEPLWGSWFLRGVARIPPDATLDGAQQELDRLAAGWSEHLPFGDGWRFVLEPLHESVVGEVAPALWLLFGAVAVVLLIACANLGGLLLARTSERRQELAIRNAIGATRGRVGRQLLTENLVLCSLGGGLGVVLAHLLVEAFRRRPPLDLPRLEEVAVDGWVLTFALAITFSSALLSWIAPAAQALRVPIDLRERSGFAGPPDRLRLRSALVVVESALAVSLLIGAGLLARSFVAITSVEPGFETVDTASLEIELPPSRYPDETSRAAFVSELERRVAALPSVKSTGSTTGLPLRGVAWIDRLQVEGIEVAAEERPQVAIDAITAGYFPTLGIPLLEGRLFDSRDHAEAPPVAIVNEELARRTFLSGSAIGRRLIVDEDQEPVTVVGVVGSVKQYGLRKETPLEYYLPFGQRPRASSHLVVRSQAPLQMLDAELRGALRSLDSSLPVAAPQPLGQALASSVDRERFYALAMGAFAILASLLATSGLYSVVAFTVERRRAELGIRMALGARRWDAFRSIVARGVALGALGVALGLAAGLLLARSLASLLFGVESHDSAVFLASAIVVAIVATVASALPARRALGVDPSSALRES